jgi:predicted PurR-regulated permease PerM
LLFDLAGIRRLRAAQVIAQFLPPIILEIHREDGRAAPLSLRHGADTNTTTHTSHGLAERALTRGAGLPDAPSVEFPVSDAERLRRVTLVAFALLISALFLLMIRDFLIALFLAALTAGLLRPIYVTICQRLGNRQKLAAGVTLGLLLVLVILPLVAYCIVVANQAVQVGREVTPWLESTFARADSNETMLRYPALRPLLPYRELILQKAGELGSELGGFAVGAVTSAAQEIITLILSLFVLLYATFFFLTHGRAILRKILYYSPLPPEDEDKMLERFLSVARATLKGTLVIGLIQGALGGLAFRVAGIGGAAFWATTMAVLSVVPGVGSAIVWIPGALYLAFTGHVGASIGLTAWCAIVVGAIDNFLRPVLVGKDAKLSDLLILVSTLGGIALFGGLGFIIGPIVAALFVTVWDIYGDVFRGVLPEPPPLSRPSIATGDAPPSDPRPKA